MVALSILVVGGEPAHQPLIARALGPLARRLEHVPGRGGARAALSRARWDCLMVSSLREVEALHHSASSAPAVVFIADDISSACAAASAGAHACVPAERLAVAPLQEAVQLACARKKALRRQALSASQDTVAMVQAATERLAVPLAWSVRLADALQVSDPALQRKLIAELRTRLNQGRRGLVSLQQIQGLGEGSVQAVDLGDVVARAQLRVRWPAGTVVHDALSPLPRIHADADQLMLAIRHVLDNAADALAEQPSGERRLVLDASYDDDSVSISISDSGAGVSPALRRRIFSPMFSTRTDRLGAGLWLADAIAARHGGRLQLTDPVALRGSCFVLTLPRETGLRVPSITDVQLVRAAPEAAPAFTALVLSQQAALVDALRALPSRPEVTAVGSVPEALAAIHSRPRYHLILCDAVTAEGDAPGFLAQLPKAMADQIIFVFQQPPTPTVARRVHTSLNRVLPWPVSDEVLSSAFAPFQRQQSAEGVYM